MTLFIMCSSTYTEILRGGGGGCLMSVSTLSEISKLSFDSTLPSLYVTNEVGCAKIMQAIGPHEILLTMLKRLKLKWYGHVSRSSGLAKTILQGTAKGGKKTRQTEEEVGRQHQELGSHGVRQVPEGSGEQKEKKNGRNRL